MNSVVISKYLHKNFDVSQINWLIHFLRVLSNINEYFMKPNNMQLLWELTFWKKKKQFLPVAKSLLMKYLQYLNRRFKKHILFNRKSGTENQSTAVIFSEHLLFLK